MDQFEFLEIGKKGLTVWATRDGELMRRNLYGEQPDRWEHVYWEDDTIQAVVAALRASYFIVHEKASIPAALSKILMADYDPQQLDGWLARINGGQFQATPVDIGIAAGLLAQESADAAPAAARLLASLPSPAPEE